MLATTRGVNLFKVSDATIFPTKSPVQMCGFVFWLWESASIIYYLNEIVAVF